MAAPRVARADAPPKLRRVGVVGIDSSHLPEFARRLRVLQEAGAAQVRVTHYWTDGEHDMPAQQVEQWRLRAEAEGVVAAGTLQEMLEAVDGVMVLGVSGHKHAAQALPALERGLPTYIDKPLACTLEDAQRILDAARRTRTPCYSASSLRFADEAQQIDRERLGELVAIDAFGPGELHPTMSCTFFYGVHTVEMVDTLWGPGVARARAVARRDRQLIDLEYRDGRYAHLRLERSGAYDFGATVHGKKSVHQFRVNFTHVYDRLVERLAWFFQTGEAPVPLRDIVENIAVMEAIDRSIARDGAWVDVPTVA